MVELGLRCPAQLGRGLKCPAFQGSAEGDWRPRPPALPCGVPPRSLCAGASSAAVLQRFVKNRLKCCLVRKDRTSAGLATA